MAGLGEFDPRSLMEHRPQRKPFASDREAALMGLANMTAFVPGLGDAAGLAADAAMYRDDPSSRNWKNYLLTGLGALPLIPALASMGRATRNVPTGFGNEIGALKPGIPTRGYHGTGRIFDDFSLDAEKTTLGGFSKYGISISEDPRVASRYAMDFYPESANVRSLSVTVNKPLSLSAQEFEYLQTAVNKLDRGEPLTELQDIGIEQILQRQGIKYTGEHPIQAIKNAGFDAIQKDAGRYGMAEEEALIFDPSKLQTEWGRK